MLLLPSQHALRRDSALSSAALAPPMALPPLISAAASHAVFAAQPSKHKPLQGAIEVRQGPRDIRLRGQAVFSELHLRLPVKCVSRRRLSRALRHALSRARREQRPYPLAQPAASASASASILALVHSSPPCVACAAVFEPAVPLPPTGVPWHTQHAPDPTPANQLRLPALAAVHFKMATELTQPAPTSGPNRRALSPAPTRSRNNSNPPLPEAPATATATATADRDARDGGVSRGISRFTNMVSAVVGPPSTVRFAASLWSPFRKGATLPDPQYHPERQTLHEWASGRNRSQQCHAALLARAKSAGPHSPPGPDAATPLPPPPPPPPPPIPPLGAVFVQAFSNGRPFVLLHGGSGEVRYRDNSAAATLSQTSAGLYTWLRDQEAASGHGRLRGHFSPLGHGAVFHKTGALWLSVTPEGCTLFPAPHAPPKHWAWNRFSPQVLELNSVLSVHVTTQYNIYLHVVCGERRFKFNMATPLRGGGLAVMPPAGTVELDDETSRGALTDKTRVALRALQAALYAAAHPPPPTASHSGLGRGLAVSTMRLTTRKDGGHPNSISSVTPLPSTNVLVLAKPNGLPGGAKPLSAPPVVIVSSSTTSTTSTVPVPVSTPVSAPPKIVTSPPALPSPRTIPNVHLLSATRHIGFPAAPAPARPITAPSRISAPPAAATTTATSVSRGRPVSAVATVTCSGTDQGLKERPVVSGARQVRPATAPAGRSAEQPAGVCPSANQHHREWPAGRAQVPPPCSCKPRVLPALSAESFDAFLGLVSPAQLVLVFFVTRNHAAGLAAVALAEYVRLNGHRRFPCAEGWADSHRVLTVTMDAATMLANRHGLAFSSVDALFVYKARQLIFAGSEYRGRPFTLARLAHLVSELTVASDHFELPPDFALSM